MSEVEEETNEEYIARMDRDMETRRLRGQKNGKGKARKQWKKDRRKMNDPNRVR